jgi:hypothetical protein
MIIGFAGRKGAGKDTAAAVLTARGFHLVKFAGPLKAALAGLLAVQGLSPQAIADMLEGPLKETPSPFFGGCTPRWAMQSLGEQWGRKLLSPDLWVEAAMREARMFGQDVVISDVRYPNEVAAIKAEGGLVARVRRPGLVWADAHVSERQIDALDVDLEITNDAPSAEAFRACVASAFAPLWAARSRP